MFASVIMQPLGCCVEVPVKPPEQDGRQPQRILSVGAEATAELPIVEPAEYRCAVRVWLDPQGPIAGPEYLAQISRGFGSKRQIRLKSKAGLSSPALQNQWGGAIAVSYLCFLCPGARQAAHVIDRFMSAIPEAKSRCDIDVRSDTAMAHYRISAQEARG